MKRLVAGIIAHVDAGKTTLSEALLYTSGAIRKLGRVDYRDAFLDTEEQERERGITIFSKQAVLTLPDVTVTLVDTPGHVDFSAEAERTLQVLDCAVLVISGTDGVQAHTRTLWSLLKRQRVPTFLFVNKMDLPNAGRDVILSRLRSELDEGCIDFGGDEAAAADEAATCSDWLLQRYLDNGVLTREDLSRGVQERRIFPVVFGSALKMENVERFLNVLTAYARTPRYPDTFGARVFKIARDAQGTRLTYMKITGGTLKVRDVLTNRRATVPEDEVWEEKADQLRVYSGAKFAAVTQAEPGMVVAVTGLTKTYPGQGLGCETGDYRMATRAVLSYGVLLPEGADVHDAYMKLRQLEDEDPTLRVVWDDDLREISLRLMGQVQMEVLTRIISQRFGLNVTFTDGKIAYMETILDTVEGVGHYEPLRHYAEVHLLLEPGEPGSGLIFDTLCSEDDLGRNWQRLVMEHLYEKVHRGVLIGAPITDMRISLIIGRAHLKHTEGGDFRQATYRAVRQGLMQAQSMLLEPWYEFRLSAPPDVIGRAITDVRRMGGDFEMEKNEGDMAVITGSAPVSEMVNYQRELSAYTHGTGRLACSVKGYYPCHNAREVIEAAAYDPEADLENTPDSVFCSHGAGFNVKWNDVPNYMHLEGLKLHRPEEPEPETPAGPVTVRRGEAYVGSREQDKQLMAIFERTYGAVKDRAFLARRPESVGDTASMLEKLDPAQTYLLVDGYNIIFAWDELKALARDDLSLARDTLMRMLINYQGYRKCNLILVFDAYKVTGGEEKIEKHGGVYVVYTREAEIADVYIERVTSAIKPKNNNVRVATSDGLEQLIILGKGALRVPASAFYEEITATTKEISNTIKEINNRI